MNGEKLNSLNATSYTLHVLFTPGRYDNMLCII